MRREQDGLGWRDGELAPLLVLPLRHMERTQRRIPDARLEASLAAASASPATRAAVAQASIQMLAMGCNGVVSGEVLLRQKGRWNSEAQQPPR